MTAYRSKPENTALDPHAFAPLRDGWEYTAIPLLDLAAHLDDGTTPICAQHAYADAKVALARHGLVMLDADDLEHLHALAVAGKAVELPAFTGTPTAETDLANRRISDQANRAALVKAGWTPGTPVANFGKGWIDGAPDGRAWLMGWWVRELARYGGSRRGPGFIQPRPATGSRGAHGAHDHADDGTNTVGKRRVATGLAPSGAGTGDSAAPSPPAAGAEAQEPARASGAAGAAPASASPVLRIGDKGRAVYDWFGVLTALDHGISWPDPDTAPFGHKTEAATKALQAQLGLPQTGIADVETQRLAQAALRDMSILSSPSGWRSPLKLGMMGADVSWWREQLRADGYAITVGTDFDKTTHNATVSWQRERGLVPVDGKVGKDTRAAIGTKPKARDSVQPPSGEFVFMQAVNYRPALRKPGDVLWLVIHTMEASEASTTAGAVARWFAGKSGPAPRASAHRCFDDDSMVQCVRLEDVAYAAPGANLLGIQYEHAGYARQSAAEWADPFSRRMLERSAMWAACDAKEFGIPIRRIGATELRARQPGFCGHADVSKAFGKSSHYDPGQSFPWDRYLADVERFAKLL